MRIPNLSKAGILGASGRKATGFHAGKARPRSLAKRPSNLARRQAAETKRFERSYDSLCVLQARFNPDIKIGGEPGPAVSGYCVRAHYEVASATGVQQLQERDPILVKFGYERLTRMRGGREQRQPGHGMSEPTKNALAPRFDRGNCRSELSPYSRPVYLKHGSHDSARFAPLPELHRTECLVGLVQSKRCKSTPETLANLAKSFLFRVTKGRLSYRRWVALSLSQAVVVPVRVRFAVRGFAHDALSQPQLLGNGGIHSLSQ
ncbi:MAG: hypothetical protein SFV15_09690 [Polyangiaceae bacterium]|nr:hypothetical protein [Polyangiaceae bacterium]